MTDKEILDLMKKAVESKGGKVFACGSSKSTKLKPESGNKKGKGPLARFGSE